MLHICVTCCEAREPSLKKAFFFRHVTSVEKDKKFGIALPLISDGPPPGHRGLTHVPHNLEPLPKLTIAWQRNRTWHCKSLPFFLLSAIRFLTNIASVFAHSSILSTPSTVFETVRKVLQNRKSWSLNKGGKFLKKLWWPLTYSRGSLKLKLLHELLLNLPRIETPVKIYD